MNKKAGRTQKPEVSFLSDLSKLMEKCPEPDKPDKDKCPVCMDRLQRALKLAQANTLFDKQMEILHLLGRCHFLMFDIDEALSILDQLLTITSHGYDYEFIHQVYNMMARLHWRMNHLDLAISFFQKALVTFKKRKDTLEVAGIYMNLGVLHNSRGNTDLSISCVNEAIKGFKKLGRIDLEYLALSNMANYLNAQGKLMEALNLKFECIAYYEKSNNLKQIAMDLNAVAVIYHKMNNLEKAIEYSLKSTRIKEELKDMNSLATNWLNLGVFYKDFGDLDTALEYYTKALTHFEAIGDINQKSMLQNNIGNIYLEREEYQEAFDCFIKSLELAEEISDKSNMTIVLENIGIIYSTYFKDYQKAMEYLDNAHKIAVEIKEQFQQASIEIQMVQVLIQNEKSDEALSILQKAEKLIHENEYEKMYIEIHHRYYEIYLLKHEYEKACRALLQYSEEKDKLVKEDSVTKIAEMQTKYETEKKEREAELYRQRNLELEAKNQEIEKQKAKLQDTLDKLHNSEIRYNFVSDELTKDIKTTLIGTSESIRKIIEMITLVAHSDKTNVLITGETGTGKEIVARNIHASSKRAKQHFYAVNCSAVPEALFESQFFGHEKDSFTGANTAKIGWFEISNKSSLFLDEIGNLSHEQQAKLLRVLEERSIIRVGSYKEIPIDVRIISATNLNLIDKVNSSEFRRDLYHRLAIFVINIPPLREHKEDIPLLLEHFVGLSSNALNKKINKIDRDILPHLMNYDYPGNIRELKNMVERAVLVTNSSTLHLENFLIPVKKDGADIMQDIIPLQDMERLMLLNTLRATGFNRVQAANLLKVDRKVIERKIKKYGLSEEEL